MLLVLILRFAAVADCLLKSYGCPLVSVEISLQFATQAKLEPLSCWTLSSLNPAP